MNIHFREACRNDLPDLVDMLSDDEFGAQREDNSRPLNQNYLDAFLNISTDSNNELIVVETDGEIAGMLQLTFIPYLTHIGSSRCLIEGVRVKATHRGHGLGKALLNWSIERATTKQCSSVQLTTDKLRADALRFYQSLGFHASHEGMKLKLE
jgi:GNAT superfamily N-acetyltransferase